MKLLIICTILIGINAIDKPEDISEEMFCLGCQVTVKELDFMLGKKPTRGIGETVTRVLNRVCDEHNFNKYDVDSKKVLKVCKHIKDNDELEKVLISEYGRKHATGKVTTYLDVSQMICSTVLNACTQAEILKNDDKDGGITYDPILEEFDIKHGKKVRIPKPVQEAKAEPNETRDTKGIPEDTVEETETKQAIDQTVVVSDSDSHDEL